MIGAALTIVALTATAMHFLVWRWEINSRREFSSLHQELLTLVKLFSPRSTSPTACDFCGRDTGDVGQFFSGGTPDKEVHICNFCVTRGVEAMDRTNVERPCERCRVQVSTWLMIDGERHTLCGKCFHDFRESPHRVELMAQFRALISGASNG